MQCHVSSDFFPQISMFFCRFLVGFFPGTSRNHEVVGGQASGGADFRGQEEFQRLHLNMPRCSMYGIFTVPTFTMNLSQM